jgi:predicted ATPase
MTKLFTSLAATDPVDPTLVQNRALSLWGRKIVVPESSAGVARFKFTDLCDRPMSAADYLEVTGTFGTIFVEGVPRMGLGERDQARRFITFIDGECGEREVPLTPQRATKTRPSSLLRPKSPSSRCFPTRTARRRGTTRTCGAVSWASHRVHLPAQREVRDNWPRGC